MNWVTSAGPPWTRCVLTASLTMSDGHAASLCPEVVVVVLVVVLVRAHPTGVQVVATTPGTKHEVTGDVTEALWLISPQVYP